MTTPHLDETQALIDKAESMAQYGNATLVLELRNALARDHAIVERVRQVWQCYDIILKQMFIKAMNDALNPPEQPPRSEQGPTEGQCVALKGKSCTY